MTPTQQVNALRAMLEAMLEAIQIGGYDGVSGGTLYSAVMGHITLDQFERLIRILVDSGRVRKDGHLYVSVK